MNADGLQKKLAELQRRKGRYHELIKLAQAGKEKVPLTDPECQSMKKVGLGYNAQFAVDAKHHLIVAAEISESPTDHSQLPTIAEVARQELEVKTLKVVADAGYQDRCAIAAAHYAGIECYVPHPRIGTPVAHGLFHKDDFVYESENDAYLCPAGTRLTRNGCFEKRGQIMYGYANPKACRVCPIKAKCIKGPYRRIERWEDESLIEMLDERTARHPEIIKKRKALVEHPFGTIKFWRNQGAFLTRGCKNVQGELSLSALAYNLGRALAILGVQALLEAIRGRKGQFGADGSRFSRRLAFWKGYSRLGELFCWVFTIFRPATAC
jgi:transposase